MNSTPLDHMLLVFHIDERRHALHMNVVQRVLPMVDVAPLPSAPAVVSGIVDVAGRIVPVMDLRRRFSLPARESRVSDVLILARTAASTVALPADGVVGVAECPQARLIGADAIVPGIECLSGVAQLDDGLVLIHDLDAFLSLHEQAQLARALRESEVRA